MTDRRELERLAAALRNLGYTVTFAEDHEGRYAGVMAYNGPGFPVGHTSCLDFAERARKVCAAKGVTP